MHIVKVELKYDTTKVFRAHHHFAKTTMSIDFDDDTMFLNSI